MLQGVNRHTHKCHKAFAPNFFGGSGVYCRNAIISAPPNLYRVTEAPRTAPSALHPKGAIMPMQQCQFYDAPTIFIWCQCEIAEMSPQKRIKGRVIPWSQKCQLHRALPIQFNGVTYPTRKRHRFVAPRGRVIRNPQQCLSMGALPNQLQGTLT